MFVIFGSSPLSLYERASAQNLQLSVAVVVGESRGKSLEELALQQLGSLFRSVPIEEKCP
jgi:hypothetical protein